MLHPMKTLTLLALGALLLLPGALQAKIVRTVDKSFTVQPGGSLKAVTFGGSITIKTSDTPGVRVVATETFQRASTEAEADGEFEGSDAGHTTYGEEAQADAVPYATTGALISTGLKKFSAIIGDGAQTGCNAVLSPGTILMPNTAVLPCVHYRGTLVSGLGR